MQRLPKDLHDMAFCIVRGYGRRKQRYGELRTAIECGSRIRALKRNLVKVRSASPADPTAEAVEQLHELDASIEAGLIEVVDNAMEHSAEGIPNANKGEFFAVLLKNCLNGRKYPFEAFNLPISRSDFYNRRSRFLYKILDDLGYINGLFL